ncbi:glycoside hydrolase family 10 protein [Arsenophonus endosymbiont of Aphis craccivora]|uniref:glycoside hydrolase family 10 protein n=1 Tax=Arsenophonus endosymbiont of Aphis craccivora TaxID=1231049 RepID=UPI0015DBF5AD|nr:glycoside hydrolase family 10 protein [Arsenophonus endosymbiont of Aphis craccivora]QLK87508.1 glycoside hydrolase family 10 protein [Arsenophonus endosymbiont of Aphis craccivora]
MLLQLKGRKWFITSLFCLFLVVGCNNKKVADEQKATIKQDIPVRGVWLTTVSRLDWPSLSSVNLDSEKLRIEVQKKELTDKLDNLVKLGINTIFFQVKPDGTVLYHSHILPWSDVLTGVVGKDPGYDPLAFIIAEAHKRNLKIHAWLNPYRVSMDTQPETITSLQKTLNSPPTSVYVLHKDWIRTAYDRFVLDPGLPEVRNWITSIVAELVKNYDIDGIQFDDYFYYETPSSKLNDEATFQRYGQGFLDKASWRRNNTLLLIREVSSKIRSLKPTIEFGISPGGVWRNISDDPRGSDTKAGGPTYDRAYADTGLWVKEGLLDYIAPQIYWPFAREIVKYDVIAKWWADVVRSTNTKLYIGVALYKVGVPSQTEPDWSLDGGVPELKRQLDLNDELPEIKGEILFREGLLQSPQTAEAVKYLKSRWNRSAQ